MSEAEGRENRILHPSSWPIAAKLWLVLLLVSLIPMGVTAVLDVWQARKAAAAAEHENMKALAESGAARVDQLRVDTRRVIAHVAGDTEVVAYLGGQAGAEASARQTLTNVVRANPDVAHVFLLDDKGRCVLSTRAEELGIDYSHRAYYTEVRDGGSYVSEILVGVTTRLPGVYFSHAVGQPLRGVAVLKLSGEVIAAMVEAMHPPGGGAFLVDRYGVIVSHSDRSLLYHSLTQLSPAVLELPAFEQRFTAIGMDHIESLGQDKLYEAMIGKPPGSTWDVLDGDRHLVGFAPVGESGWTLAVYEPEARLVEPLRRVTVHAAENAVLVGAVVTLLAFALARTIVKPVRKLTEAAQAVRRGDFAAARIDATSDDEIGALSDSFQRMARGLEARERELEIFGRMVSPEVREKLLSGTLGLGGETVWAAVLFSDIRGFSTLAEKMAPEDVVALLNEYLTEMTAATAAFHGYVNNFIGDAIVVVFGVPLPQPDAERRAVLAALAMRDALAALNVKRATRGDPPIETGIGIAAGPMVAGQIGSPQRMLYTVIGDAVNVASRLETLTKDYPGKSILVTDTVAAALVGLAGGPRAVPLGPIKLKGRTEPVEVFSIVP